MAKENPPKSKGKGKRTRSPNYPIVDLKTAIDRATVLYDQDKTHPIPVGIAQKRWNYTPFGSVGDQCIAALRAFGLLDVLGQSKDRKVFISETGERIIRNAPDRERLIQVAAIRPRIHQELWERYKETGLPSDDVIRSYLVWEREDGIFHEDAVDGVIKRFRETIAFAKLETGNITGDEDDGEPDNDSRKGHIMPPPPPGSLPLPVLMGNGAYQIVQIPRMTEAAFKFFKEQLETYKAAIITPSRGSTEESEPPGGQNAG